MLKNRTEHQLQTSLEVDKIYEGTSEQEVKTIKARMYNTRLGNRYEATKNTLKGMNVRRAMMAI